MRLTRILIVALGLVTLGCSKLPASEDIYASDLDMSITYYDQEADFTGYTTFAVADTISIVSQGGVEYMFNNDFGTQQIRNVVIDQMTNRGYTQVSKDGNPDLGISITIVKNTNVSGITYPGWWWDYGYVWGGGWYWNYPYWDYYYPWYGPTYYYSTTYGTLTCEMLDFQNKNAIDSTISVVWNGIVHGIDSGSSTDNLNRIVTNLNQCFEQSTFLNR